MFRRTLSSVLCVAFVCMFAGGVVAAPLPSSKPVVPSVVAIVDVPRILKLSKAAKSVRQQLETQRSKFQTEIAEEEAELRSSEKELIKLREAGEKVAFAELEQKLQQRFLKVERHVQTRRKALDQAFTKSMSTVRKNLVDTVSKIAKEKGINLVVVKQQVIWHDKAIDLTSSVLSRLDKALPEVPIQILSDKAIQGKKPFVIKR